MPGFGSAAPKTKSGKRAWLVAFTVFMAGVSYLLLHTVPLVWLIVFTAFLCLVIWAWPGTS
jgi:hypothetical protein